VAQKRWGFYQKATHFTIKGGEIWFNGLVSHAKDEQNNLWRKTLWQVS
jgi:hypothetical protein